MALAEERVRKKMPSLIDVLEKAVKNAGYQFERDGWEDGKPNDLKKDHCEWLEINMLDKDGNQITVHFYFVENATRLEEVSVFKAKKREGFDMPLVMAKKDWEEPEPIKKEQKDEVDKEIATFKSTNYHNLA